VPMGCDQQGGVKFRKGRKEGRKECCRDGRVASHMVKSMWFCYIIGLAGESTGIVHTISPPADGGRW